MSSTGVFTSVPGLPGTTSDFLVDINQRGTIVGWGCPNFASFNQCQTFLWVPTSPRTARPGLLIGIPIPIGFAEMVPAAINTLGDIVGVLTGAGGGYFPFLYTRGAAYDLSALSSLLSGGTPSGINDVGQIAVIPLAGLTY